MTVFALVAAADYVGSRYELQGCRHDAAANVQLHKDLSHQVESLIEVEASRDLILHRLSEALKQAGPDDMVEFDWSGHGTTTKDLDGDENDPSDEAICAWNGQRIQLVTDDDLFKVATPAHARGVRVKWKLDSCNSGDFHRAIIKVDDQGVVVATRAVPAGWVVPAEHQEAAARKEEAARRNRLARRRPLTGALAFSACREDQLASEYPVAGKVRGAFTYHSERALRQMLEVGAPVNYRDWSRATVALVNDPDQVPVLDGTASQKRWLVGQERGRR